MIRSVTEPANIKQLASKILKYKKCHFLLYSDIHKIKSIDELLPRTIILYNPYLVGHFVCVFEDIDNNINVFDPVGEKPDYMIGRLPKDLRLRAHHEHAYLSKLLYESNRVIVYNQYPLQDGGSSTCGLWCVIRILYNDLPCDDFWDCFKNIENRDELIVKIFNSI